MQVAAHILGYNVSNFIGPVIRNAGPFVDKIFIAYPRKPFGYIPSSRTNRSNPTPLEAIQRECAGFPVEIVEGDWLDEESMRNACLDRAKAEGFDWLIVQDADEFYEERTWNQIIGIMRNEGPAEHLVTTWYNFWKSSHYVLMHPNGDIKHTNATFALRCRPHLHFSQRRVTNASSSRIIDCPCHHYGYVMPDLEMAEKLATWSHAHEVDAEKWFRLKWLSWHESSRHLHPTNPAIWSRAIRFPYTQPSFADQFAYSVDPFRPRTHKDRMEDLVYDVKIALRESARSLKRTFA